MLNGTFKTLCPGLTRWENANGATVLRLHYSADSAKNSEWVEEFAKTFPGGKTGWLWQREMEISFEGLAGKRIFPEFTYDQHTCEAFDIPEEWPRWRSIDPGYEHAFVCLWMAVDGFGTAYVYREHVQKGWLDVGRHASQIKGMTGREKIEYTLIDPSAYQQHLAAQGKSVAELLSDYDVDTVPASRSAKKKHQFPPVAELLKVGENGEPRLKVFRSCPVTIKQIMGYRWKMPATDDAPDPEEPVKKEDDCCDALIYFCYNVDPAGEAVHAQRKDPLHRWYQGTRFDRIMAEEARRRASFHQEDEW